MSQLMAILGKVFRSTTFVVVLALLIAVAGGTGAFFLGRQSSLRAASETANASPATTGAPNGLQVLMSADDAATSGDAQSSGTDSAGAAGADGAAGLDGAAGADGLAGADGTAGADGVAGADGPAGPEGPAGSVGATGPAGSVGATGPAGSVGATGAAGVGLTAVEHDGGGFEFVSPDGVSYRIHVTNTGIRFEGPTTTEVWSDSSHFQTLVP